MNIFLMYSSGKKVSFNFRNGMTAKVFPANGHISVDCLPFVPSKSGSHSSSGLVLRAGLSFSREEAEVLIKALAQALEDESGMFREYKFGLAKGVQGPEPDANIE